MSKDKHHRLPRSRGGTDEPSNISVVRRKLHRAYHTLFQNMLPQEVAATLTKTWISRDYYMVAIPRKKRKPTVIRQGEVRILVQVYERGTRRWAKAKAKLHNTRREK